MNKAQMRKRCPDAVPVDQLKIRGWKLIFRGVADIIEGAENDVVCGAVWRITDDCEDSLDVYEGYRGPGRGLYTKMFFNTKKFGREPIMAYVMNPANGNRRDRPTMHYYKTIRQGYLDFGYDPKLLDRIVKSAGGCVNPQKQHRRYSYVSPYSNLDYEYSDPWGYSPDPAERYPWSQKEVDRREEEYCNWWKERIENEVPGARVNLRR